MATTVTSTILSSRRLILQQCTTRQSSSSLYSATAWRTSQYLKYGYYWKNSTSTQLFRRCFASYPPHEVVGLPSLSPTMTHGSISAWNVQVGDTFQAGDIFCSVETDKATVDFEAQDEGVIAKILVDAGSGTDIPVGSPILITVEDKSDVDALKDYVVSDTPAPAAAAQSEPEPATPPPPPPPAAPAAAAAAAPSSSTGGNVVASPLARMLAKEMGYDINQIIGSGPGGRIIAADVKEYQPSAIAVEAPVAASAPAAAAPAAAPLLQQPQPGIGYTDYPISEYAQEVAMRLMQSKRNVPHYYLTVDICVDKLLELRSKLNNDSTNIGVYEFLIKAAATSMKTVPSVNASWMDSFVRVYDSVDINIVTGSGNTLSTPLLRNVSSKGLSTISKEVNAAVTILSDDDDEETTPPTDVETGLGTFTIINIGMYGVKSCAPIIREPQSCALAIGALENRIVPNDDDDNDELYKQSVIFTATLSCDHRVVDGAVGAQWLSAFKTHIENPETLLL